MSDQEATTSNYIKLGPIGTIIAGLVFAGIGALLSFVISGSSAKLGADSENWPTVPGIVKSAKVGATGKYQRRAADKWYFPDIKYEYVVDGQTYSSDRISFRLEGIRSHSRPEIAEIVDQYNAGTVLKVFYQPEDPRVSCLEPGMNLGGLFAIGIGCIAVGLLVVLSGLFSAFRVAFSRDTSVLS